MGVGLVEDLDEVLLNEELKVEIKARLVEFWKKNQDVFAWSHRTWMEFLHP